MPTLTAFTQSSFDPASRFRILQWLPHLEALGWTVAIAPNRPPRYRWRFTGDLGERLSFLAARWRRRLNRQRDIARCGGDDVVWVNRDLLEADPRWEQRLVKANPRFVFDIDDATFLNDSRGHFATVCSLAALVIAGNETLAEAARRHTQRVGVVPTVIDTAAYPPAPAVRPPSAPLRLGWCGSDLSIRQTLYPVLPLLARLQRKLKFELHVVSRPKPDIDVEGLRWSYIEWSPLAETRLGDYFDVGIMPLQDDAYQRAKSGCKLLQYMACSLPAIASPVGVNRDFIAASKGGIAVSDDGAWKTAIEALTDPALRRSMGTQGQTWCEATMSVNRWLPVLDKLLRGVAERR
jgi:glycosyltransferase involved in cell wall biosynthesis